MYSFKKESDHSFNKKIIFFKCRIGDPKGRVGKGIMDNVYNYSDSDVEQRWKGEPTSMEAAARMSL